MPRSSRDVDTETADGGKWLLPVVWSLAAATALAAIIVWGQSYDWKLDIFNAYELFPLLGLLAFSLMWTHYVSGPLRELSGQPEKSLKPYFESTSLIVLGLLVLHPGLLILQRFLDGFGLPPGSYKSYVAPGLGWITLLGTASLLAFLLFETRRFFNQSSWWKYVLVLNDAAMLAIVYHGLRLGGQLQSGWYRYLWFLYGAVLVAILARKYWRLTK